MREFFAVTLPGLRGELAVALTLTTIFALRTFDLIYVADGGRARHVDDRAVRGSSTRTRSRPAASGWRRRWRSCSRRIIFVVAFAITRLVDRDPSR